MWLYGDEFEVYSIIKMACVPFIAYVAIVDVATSPGLVLGLSYDVYLLRIPGQHFLFCEKRVYSIPACSEDNNYYPVRMRKG